MNMFEPSDEERAAWDAWVAERPPAVRAVAEGFFPWTLYRLKSSGHRVTLYSIDEPEDGSAPTLSVIVSGKYNAVAFERRVFGVAPENLEECELPGPNEPTGSLDLEPETAIAAYVGPIVGGIISGVMGSEDEPPEA